MKDPFQQDFGKRAKIAMQASGYGSAAELAKVLNEEDSRVRNWTNGSSVPPLRDVARLAEAFGVTIDWLVTGETSGLAEGMRIRLVAVMSGVLPPVTQARDPAGDAQAREQAKPGPASKRRSKDRATAGAGS